MTGCGTSGPGWGNGKAIAVLLARQGARVAGIDREPDALEHTRRLIEDEGGSFHGTVGDVTHAETAGRFIEECRALGGRIDVLVNSVGRSVPGGPVELECIAAGACTLRDDFSAVMSRVYEADPLILATPLYWYGPSAQLKALRAGHDLDAEWTCSSK